MTPEERLKRVYAMSVASVYPHYIAKAEKKGRTKAEVDEVIRWLTGYTPKRLQTHLDKETDFETFFAKASGHRSMVERCRLWSEHGRSYRGPRSWRLARIMVLGSCR